MKTLLTIRFVWCFAFAGVGVTSAQAQAAKDRYKIYEIEAGYIYNFIDFVNWPENLPGSPDTLVIGILGENKFENAFAPVEGTKIGGKILSVRKSRRIEDLINSRILFIASSESSRLDQIFGTLKSRPILTVGNMDGFMEAGGMIQFYTTEINGDIKVRFDIDKERVDQSGLKISFRLLTLARPKR